MKNEDADLQMLFNFSPPEKPQKTKLSCFQMRQSVIAWLSCHNPSGIAVRVPTRISKFCADTAAFWSRPSSTRLLQVVKTVIVEIRHGREACWPDCSNKENLLAKLRECKERKARLEAQIRKQEPHLQDTDVLFAEYQRWNYEQSSNKDYRRCRRDLEKLELALYDGSRFERIRRSHVADYLYLAVPENSIGPNELAEGWGLLYVNENQQIREILQPAHNDCPAERRMHFVQNIAAAASANVYSANGIRINNSQIELSPAPRKRKTKKRITIK